MNLSQIHLVMPILKYVVIRFNVLIDQFIFKSRDFVECDWAMKGFLWSGVENSPPSI